MVLREVYPRKSGLEPKVRMAPPGDRLTAVVLDAAFIIPIIAVCVAPLQKQIFIFRLIAQDWNVILGGLATGLVGFAAALIYQSLFWYYWNSTPGQRILGLRVKSLDKTPVEWNQALMRSLVWLLQLAMLGLPFLSVFGHRQRRPWHDRISETECVSVRGRAVAGPHPVETMLFTALQRTGASMLALFAVILVSMVFHAEDGTDLPNIASECREIISAQSELQKIEKDISRMEAAMSLYASDELSLECLESEAQSVLWSAGKNVSMAYLAMAFVKMDNSKLSNAYYQKICEESEHSSSCQLSELMVQFEKPREKWQRLDIDFTQLNYPSQLWTIRFANRMGQFQLAMDIMKSLYVIPQIANFIGEQKVRALSGLDEKNEAETILATISNSMRFKERNHLLAWYCSDQLQRSCDQPPSACRMLEQNLDLNDSVAENELSSLAMYRLESCRNPKNLRILGDNPSAVRFQNAMEAQTTDKNLTPLRLMAFEASETPYVIESRVKLAELTDDPKDFEELKELWKKSREVGQSWDRMAVALINGLIDKGEFEQTIEVADLYVGQRPRQAKSIAVILDRMKSDGSNKKLNASMLKRAMNSRQPASVSK